MRLKLLPAGHRGGAGCPHTCAPVLLEAAGHAAWSSGSGLGSSGTSPDSRFRNGGREKLVREKTAQDRAHCHPGATESLGTSGGRKPGDGRAQGSSMARSHEDRPQGRDEAT